MRLFVAVLLSEEMKDSLCLSRDALRERSEGGNFSRRENLHLTLAFLDEQPPERMRNINRAMKKAAAEIPPFELKLDRAGRFTRPGADLWWVGTEKNPRLRELADRLNDALRQEGFGFLPEKSRFTPHLTVARQVEAPGLRCGDIAVEPAAMRVEKISLMESERLRGVLTYTEKFSVALAGPV